MTLQEYLERYNISIRDLAKICNLSTGVFYNIIKGQRISDTTADIILKKTNGILDLQYKELEEVSVKNISQVRSLIDMLRTVCGSHKEGQ